MDRGGESTRVAVRIVCGLFASLPLAALATVDALAQYPANIDLGTLASPTGVKINGIVPSQQSGFVIDSAGDLTGDGIADLVIGSPYQTKPGGGEQAGAALLIYGAAGLSTTSSMNALQSSPAGYYVRGRQAFDNLGWSVSRVGDVNLDGKADFLVGAPNAESNIQFGNEGEAYLIYGRAAGLPSVVDITTLNPSIGSRIRGAITDGACGMAVAGIGDLDGDGRVDLAIAATKAGTPTNRIETPFDAFDAAAGDVTGDGVVDIVATHPSQGQFSILQGLGGGLFAGGVAANSFVSYPEAIELVDADVDGDLDLILVGDNGLATQGVVSRLLNFGTGFFAFPTPIHIGNTSFVDMDLADADSDGDPDLLVLDNPAGSGPGQATIVYNTILPGLVGAVTLPVNPTSQVATGTFADLQNDSFPEAVVGERIVNTITVYSDANSGNLAGQQFLTPGAVAGATDSDVDGDGDMDVGVFAPRIRTLVNAGGGSLTLSPTMSTTNIEFGASWGDFDNDSRLDVVDITDPSKRGLRMHGNAGNGTFDLPMTSVQDIAIHHTRVSDLDANGRDDVVVVYSQQGLKKVGFVLSTEEGLFPGEAEGRVYVVRGSSPALAAGDVNLATLGPADGFEIRGPHGGGEFGSSLAAAGDLDADGFDDFLIGMRGSNANAIGAGDGFVLFGSATLGAPSPSVVTSLPSASLFRLRSSKSGSYLGTSAAGGSDLDADGIPEIIFGAPFGTVGATAEAGSVAVVRGTAVTHGGEILDSGLGGANGFRIETALTERAGFSVAGGDVNSDGVGDVAFGCPEANANGVASGRAYVVFGKVALGGTGLIDHALLPAGQSVRFNGAATIDRAGFAVSVVPDLNTDGYNDFLVGAPLADPASNLSAGITYLVHGKPSTLGVDKTVISLASGGSQGFSLRAGSVHAGKQYVILGSFSGTSPGLQVGSVLLPLNFDAYTTLVATYLNTPIYANFLGNLDLQGKATATLMIPPGIVGVPPHLLLNHAYLVLNANQALVLGSNACPIYLDP